MDRNTDHQRIKYHLRQRQPRSPLAHHSITPFNPRPRFLSSGKTQLVGSVHCRLENHAPPAANLVNHSVPTAPFVRAFSCWSSSSDDLKTANRSNAPVFEGALRLSAVYSRRLGTRTLDLLHVAAACLLDAKEFITSDQRQSDLAQREGLKVVLIL